MSSCRLGWQRLRRLAVRRQPLDDLQTVQGARRNIGRHYDLSNELFALFLGETMTYSSALFQTGADGAPVAAPDEALAAEVLLAEAQHRKIDRLLDRAGVRPGRPGARGRDRLGRTGHPAHCGASVRHRHASRGSSRRSPPAGWPRPGWPAGSACELRDYRDVEGDVRRDLLGRDARGGRRALLGHLLRGPRRSTWRRAGGSGCRPSPCRTTGCWPPGTPTPGSRSTSSPAGFSRPSPRSRTAWPAPPGCGSPPARTSAPHYAQTLKIWRERFGARADEVARLGFDEVFNRMWTFYLCYSEAGFRAGYIGVSQLTLARPIRA